jgi:integrase
MSPPAATEGQGADMALLARLRYIATDRDRHKNLRIYVRRHGRKIRLRETPGTKAFMAEYQAALAGTATPAPSRRHAPDDGSLQHLIDSYMKSATWRTLAALTQATRRGVLERAAAEPVGDGTAGALPFALMERRHVVMLRDRIADRPSAANNRVKALRQMFTWAQENDLATTNPARHVRRLDTPGTGWKPWTLDDIQTFARHHADNPRAMLALHLLVWTGVRRSDLAQLGRQHIRALDGRPHLVYVQHKGRDRHPRKVEHLITPGLQQALNRWADPKQLTFLTTARGEPFSIGGIGNRMRAWCDQAGLTDVSAHGVRKGIGDVTAELGATQHQIMALLGHANPGQSEVYTRNANRRRMGAQAIEALDAKLSHLHPDAE